MPIFEFICKDCKKSFELLVYGSRKPECPDCKSTQLDQQLSSFSVRGYQNSSQPVAAGPGRGECGAGGCGSCGGFDA